MKKSQAEIVREYGPFPDVEQVNGVSFDGQNVWLAAGDRLHALDPASGALVRSLEVSAQAGTAFDGRHLYQLAEGLIQKLDPATGEVLSTLPAPDGGASGMAWAEGALWVGQYRQRKIHQLDPESGKILRTLESSRFVTGVTWVDGELWHGARDDERSELRQIDPQDGQVLQALEMPPGVAVSGLESDGADTLYCGGGNSGKVRAVRRPRQVKTTDGRTRPKARRTQRE
jgi:glutamine cyclotransferase